MCVCSHKKVSQTNRLIYNTMHVWKTADALLYPFAWMHNGSDTSGHMCMCTGLCLHMLADGVGSAASLAMHSRIGSQANACMRYNGCVCVFN